MLHKHVWCFCIDINLQIKYNIYVEKGGEKWQETEEIREEKEQ